jgi:site-specific recombinase XerD
MRLFAATTRFTRQLAANGCSVHTQKAYTRDLRAFARWLGRMPHFLRSHLTIWHGY